MSFDTSATKNEGNQPLEIYLRQYISPKINFTIEDFLYEGITHIVMFKIPAAANEPTCFKKEAYIRVDSCVTELAPY